MKSGLLWLLLCLAAWGAVVPDASVVEPDAGAPRLPSADPAAKHSPVPGRVPSHPKSGSSATPAQAGAVSEPAQVAVPTSGGAFSDHNSTDPSNTGESRPLEPLAPAPVSTGSATPLWAALIVFLFLAVGGFWLAQRRDQE
ncbi:MAG: hypothetical protein KF760_06780 [Candidatus Eremiobacteraeota bacterium]|nr:hypothetical protein [Candidatus Eremiobacteraeota bacterium]MCW5866802.1 hypothetical protein [Candidatus Eremiobacteraeota bacterium]